MKIESESEGGGEGGLGLGDRILLDKTDKLRELNFGDFIPLPQVRSSSLVSHSIEDSSLLRGI